MILENPTYSFVAEVGVLYKKFAAFDKYQWKKGDNLMGFKVPFNCIGTVPALFSRFQLWQNKNGVCVKGRELTEKLDDGTSLIFRRTKQYIISYVPLYVGDTLNNESVIYSKNIKVSYNGIELWKCSPILGEIPEPIVYKNTAPLEHLQSVYDLIFAVSEKMLDLVESYNTQVIKNTGISVPILPPTLITPPMGGTVTGSLQAFACLTPPDVLGAIKQGVREELKDFFKKAKASILC